MTTLPTARCLLAPLAALLLSMLSGCGAGDGVLRVLVQANPAIDGISKLVVKTTKLAGAESREIEFPLPGATRISVDAPQTFGLRLAKEHLGGPLSISVVAFDSVGMNLGAGATTGRVDASGTMDVAVVLKK